MALVNITKAAKLAGISRQYFHNHYVNKGKITVSHDSKGNPQVDTSEILRVFGLLHDDVKSLQDVTPPDSSVLTVKIEALQRELALKDQLLEEKQNRIDDLKSSLLLLTDVTQNAKPRKKILGIF